MSRDVTKLSILYFWLRFWAAVTRSGSNLDGASGIGVCFPVCAGVTNKPILLMRFCFSPSVSVRRNEFYTQLHEYAQVAGC